MIQFTETCTGVSCWGHFGGLSVFLLLVVTLRLHSLDTNTGNVWMSHPGEAALSEQLLNVSSEVCFSSTAECHKRWRANEVVPRKMSKSGSSVRRRGTRHH